METSNASIAKLLRHVAAAYTIKKIGNIFQIRAYENVASSIEHSTASMHDLWREGRLAEVPGLGKTIQGYLDELLKKGKVSHFEAIQKGIPEVVFDLLSIPGVGPKTADKIGKMGIKSLGELEKALKSGKLQAKGFSPKLAEGIILGFQEISSRGNRMLLPYALEQAERILTYLKKSKDVKAANYLGSLRRMVVTVGDLDFAVSSDSPARAVEHFVKMPGVARVIDKGETKATVVLLSGIQADLLVGPQDAYGALLQHFTGSKSHNIHLRTLAERRGLSLSEYGVKKGNKLQATGTEEEFYKLLGMQTPPPEIREDLGEIEAGLEHKLSELVELKDIKGDLHTHSNYPFDHPSHAPGVSTMEEIIKKAISLGYTFIGISDHPPGHGVVSKQGIIKAVEMRTKVIQKIKQSTKSIRVLNGLEIDILPDGSVSVPDEALASLDYCIAGIHSGHRGTKEIITKRLLAALENPHVDIISHPTNRLLNERDSSEADWEQIFKSAAKLKKLLEINAYPNRLDLRDDLVRQAKVFGVKFVINTDAHRVDQMDNMVFGVSVARRGWAEKKEIVNSWNWNDFTSWFSL